MLSIRVKASASQISKKSPKSLAECRARKLMRGLAVVSSFASRLLSRIKVKSIVTLVERTKAQPSHSALSLNSPKKMEKIRPPI